MLNSKQQYSASIFRVYKPLPELPDPEDESISMFLCNNNIPKDKLSSGLLREHQISIHVSYNMRSIATVTRQSKPAFNRLGHF
jgi:hypothetical protein